MPERFFRYVRAARVHAWERAGWKVISPPLSMRPPLGFEHANGSPIDVVIVEWQQSGQPVEPNRDGAIAGATPLTSEASSDRPR
jgi:hypothetical protein